MNNERPTSVSVPSKRPPFFGAGALLSVALLAACKKPETLTSSVASGPSASAAVPADRLARGELVPGKESAFALVLPRDFELGVRLSTSTTATGKASLEDASNYVRARVADGKIELGANETRFDDVRVPEDPKRLLRIRITKEPFGQVRMTIEDTTPLALEPEDEASRMKRVGLTKDGKVIDPSHLE
jgi:hypothetical protein